MSAQRRHVICFMFVAWGMLIGCQHPPRDPEWERRGELQVVARLLETPDTALRQRPLYNHAGIFPYEVLRVYRGPIQRGEVVLVGHYNPWKPRGQAADHWVRDVSGTLMAMRAGDVHRLALESRLEDHFMGGVIHPYAESNPAPVYWAVWTAGLADRSTTATNETTGTIPVRP
jgi:hypothetical protein